MFAPHSRCRAIMRPFRRCEELVVVVGTGWRARSLVVDCRLEPCNCRHAILYCDSPPEPNHSTESTQFLLSALARCMRIAASGFSRHFCSLRFLRCARRALRSCSESVVVGVRSMEAGAPNVLESTRCGIVHVSTDSFRLSHPISLFLLTCAGRRARHHLSLACRLLLNSFFIALISLRRPWQRLRTYPLIIGFVRGSARAGERAERRSRCAPMQPHAHRASLRPTPSAQQFRLIVRLVHSEADRIKKHNIY